MFAPKQNETNLGSVPVRDHNAISSLQQVSDMPHRFYHCGVLVRHALVSSIFNQRVSARGNDEGFHIVEQLAVTASLVLPAGDVSIINRVGRFASARLSSPAIATAFGAAKPFLAPTCKIR